MNTQKRLGLGLVGLGIWASATVLFQITGPHWFETAPIVYWLNVVLTAVLCAIVPIVLMKAWNIPPQDWLQGSVCLALPGLLGEVPILYSFPEVMNQMQPETAGRYAALLFANYAALLGVAGLISLHVSRTVDEH